MLGFLKSKKHFLGVDIGSSTAKLVEFSVDGKKLKLENYAWADYGGRKNISKKELLEVMIKRADFGVRTSYLSLPAYSSLISLIEFPQMKEEELDKAIRFEANKYIPASLEEVVLSWSIVGQQEKKTFEIAKNSQDKIDKKIQVLLVAAPKRKVKELEEMAKYLGLKVEVIELEVFSLARALVSDGASKNLVIDMGSEVTNIIFAEGSNVKVNRTLDMGGSDVTKAIADSMNISLARAEQLKRESADLFSENNRAMLVPFLNQINSEVNRVLSLCYNIESKETAGNINGKVDKIILSGGTAKLKGLREYLESIFKTPTVIADPWRDVQVAPEYKSLIEQLGPSFSVAVGLAKLGYENYIKN